MDCVSNIYIMIDFVCGKLFIKEPLRVVINHNGIGIELQVPISTSAHLPKKGEEVTLLTHLHWRQEDSPQLFGFFSEDERSIFKILIGVNKVGPKLAINIMSATDPLSLATMILSEDAAKLTSLKGVGPKVASRLIVETKEKIAKLGIGVASEIATEIDEGSIPYENDVREALESLGYSSREINKGIKLVSSQIASDIAIEDIISRILQLLN